MLCENCKKKEANFHKVSNINGKITEYHLCSDCANKANITMDDFSDIFEDFKNYENEFLGSFFNNNLLSESSISLTKNANEYYIDEEPKINLKNFLETKQEKKQNKIKALQEELNKAVKEERYEYAQKLKNQIEKLKKEEK